MNPPTQCGARTRTCECGHHRKAHEGGTGRCGECRACAEFRPRPCRNPGGANGRCRMHGRSHSARSGIHNPAFRHGRYSRHLPSDLGERYAAALASGDLLSLRDEVAVLETRIGELLAEAAPAPAQWRAAREAFSDMRAANRAGDQARLGAAVTALGQALDAGTRASAAWGELGGLMERKRRLARDEVRRVAASGQAISAERAMVLVSALADAVMRHVTDPEARRRVQDDFRRLVGATVRPGG